MFNLMFYLRANILIFERWVWMWKDDRLSCSDAQHEMWLTAALKNVILKALLVDRSNTPKGDGPKQSYRGESAVCGHFIMKLTLKQVFWCQYVLLSEIRSLPRIRSLTHVTHRAIQIRETLKVKIYFLRGYCKKNSHDRLPISNITN